MGRNLYIGDWHYGHSNIIRFDNRPFNSVDEMNRELIQRWNSVAQPDDTIHVVGDMFWTKASEAVPVLKMLTGNKILVKGNHDRCHDNEFKKQFGSIKEYMEIKDGGRDVVLCHYPMPCFKNHFYGWYHLYAHVHTSFEWNMMESVKREMTELYGKPCKMYNVGAMMPYMDYTPRTLDEILKAVDG